MPTRFTVSTDPTFVDVSPTLRDGDCQGLAASIEHALGRAAADLAVIDATADLDTIRVSVDVAARTIGTEDAMLAVSVSIEGVRA